MDSFPLLVCKPSQEKTRGIFEWTVLFIIPYFFPLYNPLSFCNRFSFSRFRYSLIPPESTLNGILRSEPNPSLFISQLFFFNNSFLFLHHGVPHPVILLTNSHIGVYRLPVSIHLGSLFHFGNNRLNDYISRVTIHSGFLKEGTRCGKNC